MAVVPLSMSVLGIILVSLHDSQPLQHGVHIMDESGAVIWSQTLAFGCQVVGNIFVL